MFRVDQCVAEAQPLRDSWLVGFLVTNVLVSSILVFGDNDVYTSHFPTYPQFFQIHQQICFYLKKNANFRKSADSLSS